MSDQILQSVSVLTALAIVLMAAVRFIFYDGIAGRWIVRRRACKRCSTLTHPRS